MLYDQDLSLFLWAEACNTAVYLQNRIPHRVVGSRTPEEAFTGRKADVGHFRMFGCLTYSHVPFEKRTKLEPTAFLWVTVRLLKDIRSKFPSNGRLWLGGM